jgi:hypothetical protein
MLGFVLPLDHINQSVDMYVRNWLGFTLGLCVSYAVGALGFTFGTEFWQYRVFWII